MVAIDHHASKFKVSEYSKYSIPAWEFWCKKNDVIFMTVGSQVPNHGAVYLGDGKIGHHQVGRLSSIDVYGGWYEKITTHIARHK